MASGLIQPRQVDRDAWRRWIGQGFELVSRKWPAWVAIMTAACLLTGAAGMAEPIALFLTLAVGYNLAVAVDHESDWAGLTTRFGALFREAALFGFQAGMFMLLSSIPLDVALAAQAMVLPEGPAPFGGIAGWPLASGSAALLPALFERSANNLLTWAMLLPVGLAFVYPLRGLGLGFFMALAQGRRAVALNRKPVILMALLSFATVLGFLGLRLYPLIPLALGFWMAVNYVMFRDIFLGASENLPVRAASAAKPATAGATA
jgi:hypothetical protein